MFSLPRLPIDDKDEDHNASAIALNAPLPKSRYNPQHTSISHPDLSRSPIIPPVPTSKIGRRQFTEDVNDPWEFNAW